MRKARYLIEYALLFLIAALARALPVDTASALGGYLGRLIGPRLPMSRIARANLDNILPQLTEQKKKRIMHDMWENLGRVMCEYPHLKYLAKYRVSFDNPELLKSVNASRKPAVFVTGHLGNWELGNLACFLQYDAPLGAVFRAPNNPFAARLIQKFRSIDGQIEHFPKSAKGTRDMVKHLKSGKSVAIVNDQKYNQGPALEFMGHKARCSTAAADMALKYDYPLIPGRIIREKGAHFRFAFDAPLSKKKSNGKFKSSEEITSNLNKVLESWIKDTPEQWLWTHRRWSGSWPVDDT